MNPVEFLPVQPFAPLSGHSGQKNNSELNSTIDTPHRTEGFQRAARHWTVVYGNKYDAELHVLMIVALQRDFHGDSGGGNADRKSAGNRDRGRHCRVGDGRLRATAVSSRSTRYRLVSRCAGLTCSTRF